MAMTWMFLLVVFAALCFLAMIIGVLVMVFRAAAKSSSRPPGDPGTAVTPPVIADDSLTNPAHPLFRLHHPTTTPDDPSRHQAIDPGPSPSAFDGGSSPSPSFDAGSSPASSDSGGAGCG